MNFTDYLVSLVGTKEAGKIKAAISEGKTIIVAGPEGPTGKTVLTRVLNKFGYSAVEAQNTYTVTLGGRLSNVTPFFENEITRKIKW